jgi:hypothetical protein
VHVDEVLLTHNGLNHKPQVLGDGVAVALSDDLARVLDRKFDLQFLVPIRIDFQFSLSDPFGIVLVDVLDLEIVGDVEFFQSCQD